MYITQKGCQTAENAVAVGMAACIVNEFELVDIDEGQGKGFPLLLSRLQGMRYIFLEGTMVAESRERIGESGAFQVSELRISGLIQFVLVRAKDLPEEREQ
jgi:hypothetical protein